MIEMMRKATIVIGLGLVIYGAVVMRRLDQNSKKAERDYEETMDALARVSRETVERINEIRESD